jgi:hypothetical protein
LKLPFSGDEERRNGADVSCQLDFYSSHLHASQLFHRLGLTLDPARLKAKIRAMAGRLFVQAGRLHRGHKPDSALVHMTIVAGQLAHCYNHVL